MSGLACALATLAAGRPLEPQMMKDAMALILGGGADPVQLAGFLMGLRARGETVSELVAAAQVLRSNAMPVIVGGDIVDTCGTGGDGANTFNVSTAAAIIAAGAGVRIAKHGNRAASSRSGSSDVFEALGVNLGASPARIARSIESAGIGVLFAPAHHPGVGAAAPVRKMLGVRTLFNLIGPLSNPAGAQRQLLGVFDRALVRPMAQALLELGAKRALVVHGADGLDEFTTTGVTHVASLEDGAISDFTISPEEVGLPRCAPSALRGGDPASNAEAIRALLRGAPGPFRDIALLNAAGALLVAGRTYTLTEGLGIAAASVDSGAALNALERLVAITNGHEDMKLNP